MMNKKSSITNIPYEEINNQYNNQFEQNNSSQEEKDLEEAYQLSLMKKQSSITNIPYEDLTEDEKVLYKILELSKTNY